MVFSPYLCSEVLRFIKVSRFRLVRKLGKTDCGPVPGFLFFCVFSEGAFFMPASGRLSFRASGIFRTSVSVFPGFARFFVHPDWPVPFSGKFRRSGFSGRGAALNAFRIKHLRE